MAETEVSTEVSNVVGIEEKCLSEMSSCKDLPKPDSNGTSDLENSYVFVSGDDGLSDDTVGDKDAGGEGLSILPESKAVTVEERGEKLDAGNEKLDPENAKLDHESEKPYSEKLDPESEKLDPESEKLDTVSTEVSEPLNERENGNVELRNGDLTVVNVSTSKLESSLEQGDGGEVSLADSVEDNIGETEIVVEAEVEVVKDPDGEIAEAVVDQNVVASDSRDVSVEANDEVKLEREVVKTLEVEVPTSTFLDLDLKTCPIKNEEETLMEISRENVELNIVSSNTNDSGNANDECADQINLSVTEASEASRGSKDVVVNVADCDLQDVSKETNDEIKSEREVVETAAHEIPASTSSDLELEPHPINNKEEKVEEEATLACRTEVSDKFDVEEGAANIVSDKRDVEDMVDQLDGAVGNSNDNLSLQENEESENSSSNNISVASIGGSSIDGEAAIIKTKPKPFNFLVRVPRFDDESLREQIRLAKLHVDEKTKLREAVQVQIQEKRANTQIHGIDYEYAKGEARSARKLVRSKRVEIDSLQAVINKAKNALSIEDIDSQMYNMERMIQHETLPLKEEKQLIREIKQLKQIREQLSSNIGSQDEINQALEQREEVEERLKILRKELDVLKGRVLKSEAVATEAEKKYDDENKKVRELQTQFRAANDVRQEAYAQWQDLRKELSEKTKHFFKYKDSAALANNYAFTRDREALYRLCFNNVENFMELWNTSEEFRTDYVKFNARSYVRRFGTLDGRALGPDEEPPILPSYVNDRVKMVPTPVKVDVLTSQTPTLELKQEPMVENVTSEVKTVKKMTELKNQEVTNKGLAIHIHSNGLDTVSVKEIPDEVQEEPKKSKEEIESIRKVEERRKEEVEAKLKEERRLEALAKANEARERKKRQAEKLQMRAELKTQKEAELKEKEREKRQRKKERKKAASDVNDIDTAPSSETASVISIDTEAKDTTTTTTSSSAVPKKAQKSWLFAKQSKAKSVVPPALRNRNKKRLQQWMWVGVTSLVILLLFWLGNIGVFSSIHYKRRSPVI
ncbi:PREDICTED: proton pump-interactor 1 isoform X2 [Erythranthe guttata]|uniref:proton pump-interactor 1 isoform X2 n=1 Tax=Erythranthe guttata TaxID=4155 RepID=UPI00064DBE32|nr:PREDICTED: proton pump-interactor 1 isoform X2 [Erythranthe guttata]|eukprot:XP_012832809.1 PREDICTED: proton pump-interactor 1 isoform X2 [Erythranthe guttata]